MDARQLEYFLAIVDHDGFGRAAAHLHITQPALSQAVAGFERELGVTLFHRIGRGVVVSAAGSELIGPARQVLRDLHTTRARMDSLKGVTRGRVELISMPAPGMEPLATLTRRFTRRHPGVTVQVAGAFSPDEVVHRVRQGACELGLVGTSGVLAAPGIEVHLLERQPFVLVGAPGPGFPTEEPIPLSDLAGVRLIDSPGGGPLMRRIVDNLIASGEDLQIVAELEHRTSILPMVMQGVGMAVLPSAWAPLARLAGARVARLQTPATLDVWIIRRNAPMTPAAHAFMEVARLYRPADHLRAVSAEGRPTDGSD